MSDGLHPDAVGVLVLADDRTGAMEVAGAIAPAVVVPYAALDRGAAGRAEGEARAVIDLGTRHLEPAEAAARVGGVLNLARTESVRQRVLHKLDSTLRGNWADEAVALQRSRSGPVVVVAAFPAVGRTCRGGTVYDHGVPVANGPAGADPRRPVTTSRPAEALVAAGATAVVELAGADDLAAWLGRANGGFAVCDAETDADLAVLGRCWAEHATSGFLGTAASIGAAVATIAGRAPDPAPADRLGLPALVVCGSLHPAARAQIARLEADGWTVLADPAVLTEVPERLVLVSPMLDPGVTGHGSAAMDLAGSARGALAARRWASVVVVGGDTAEALLGDEPIHVGGLLGPGMPSCAHAVAPGAVLVTKPGGFGGPGAVAELFGGSAES